MGGIGSGRKAKQPKPERPKVIHCAYCGASMYNGNRTGGRQKLYCSIKCKQAAYRARRAKVAA
jgi:hypothetical protein